MQPPRMISLEISFSRHESCFRILAGARVKYVVVAAGALDQAAMMDMPLDFADILPPLPFDADGWNFAHISRDDGAGQLTASLSQRALPGVADAWHPVQVD